MKVLYVIAQDGFQDVEFNDSRKELDESEIDIDVASVSTGTAKGKYGMELIPDLAVKDAAVDDYDMITLIGGPGAPKLAQHPEVLDKIKEFKEKGKLISAICIAPTVLAKAGVLNGKRSTVWTSEAVKDPISVIEKYGGTYVDEPVVVDGDTITGNGPGAAKEFGKALVKALNK